MKHTKILERFIKSGILVSFAILMIACHRPFSPGKHILRHVDRLADSMDLNDRQEVKYQNLRSRIESDIKQAKKAHIGLLGKMEQEFAVGSVNIQSVAKTLKDHHNKRDKAMSKFPDYLVEFYTMLEPKQQKEFNEIVSSKLKKIRRHLE